MKIIKVILIAIFAIQTGCASVRTSSDYEDIKLTHVAKAKYKTCIVSLAYFDRARHGGTAIVPDVDNPQLPEILQIVATSGICENTVSEEVKYAKLENAKDPKSLGVSLGKIAKKTDSLRLIFFEKDWTHDFGTSELMALYGIIYVGTLGLIPFYNHLEKHIWLAIQEPNSISVSVSTFENTYGEWYWTPFYLSSSSLKGWSATEKSRNAVSIMAIEAATNSLAKP